MCGSSCVKTFSLLYLGVRRSWNFGSSSILGLTAGLPCRSSSHRECRNSVEELSVQRPSLISALGGLGAESESESLSRETFWSRQSLQGFHQMRIGSLKTFSLWFRVVVLKFWFLNFIWTRQWYFNDILKTKNHKKKKTKERRTSVKNFDKSKALKAVIQFTCLRKIKKKIIL